MAMTWTPASEFTHYKTPFALVIFRSGAIQLMSGSEVAMAKPSLSWILELEFPIKELVYVANESEYEVTDNE